MLFDSSAEILLKTQAKYTVDYSFYVDYTANGSHLLCEIKVFKEMCRKPISQHPGLGPVLVTLKIGLEEKGG